MSNVTSVENINLNVTGAQTIDAASANFIQNLTAIANSTLTINNLGSLPTVSLSNTTQAAVTTFNIINSALSGTNALTINLTGGHAGAITVSDTAGTNTLETITINSTANNTIDALTTSGMGATTLNIGGSGQLVITALTDAEATIKTINGSTNSGGFSVAALAGGSTVTGGSGNDSITGGNGNDSIAGGAGNDTLTFATGNLTSNDTVDGGTGVNTLVADKDDVDTAAITTAWNNVSNVQTLQFSDALDGDTITTANIASSINRINITQATTDAAADPTFNFAAGASTVGLNVADALGANTFTIDAAGTGTSDSLTIINMRATGVTTAADSNLTITDYETVTFNTGATASSTQLINILNAGTAALSITGVNGLTTTDTTGVITAASIDASGLTGTGALVMGAAAASITSITGSANADTLVGDTSTSIAGGAGNDNITGGALADTIRGEAGFDTIDGGAGNDLIEGGSGNDRIIIAVDANLNASDTISGGADIDTLVFNAAITDAASTLSRVSEFEILELAPNAAQTLTMSNFINNQGFTRVDVSTLGNTLTLNNVSSTLNEMRLITADATSSIVFDRLVDTATDTLTISSRAVNTAGDAIVALTANDEETINISGSSAANDLTITTVTAGDLKTLNISGAADVVITNAIANATLLTTVDASTATGAVTINASIAAGSVTMTGNSNSTAAATFTGSGVADTITGGGGADALSGGAGADVISGGAGADTITGGSGADTMTGGSGSDDYIQSNQIAGAAVNLDVITDFSATNTDQIGNWSIANLETLEIAGAAVFDMTLAGAATSIANGQAFVFATVTAAYDLGTDATASALIIDGNFNTSSLATALQTGGSRELTANGIRTDGDTFFVVYDNGVDSFFALATTTAEVADNATFAALTITNLVQLTGVADATTIAAANTLAFVA